MNYMPYAQLRTIDGEEVKMYTKPEFETILLTIKTKKSMKNNRLFYTIEETIKSNGLHLFKDDYFEVSSKD
ncbi:MAG: hypothetical protein B7X89_01945 [Sulfuricurvum sp. 17-40-25]|nr:MAG: hypothetical protein B7Y30_01405 [Campylobacterales bacterium 16-40-21]OZA04332.1 MAG: hypothetical protein B7X89_01945 [Sulfuricurvum sp. 17-40-25]